MPISPTPPSGTKTNSRPLPSDFRDMSRLRAAHRLAKKTSPAVTRYSPPPGVSSRERRSASRPRIRPRPPDCRPARSRDALWALRARAKRARMAGSMRPRPSGPAIRSVLAASASSASAASRSCRRRQGSSPAGAKSSGWLARFIPMPITTTERSALVPPTLSSSIPATLSPASRTSLGHLRQHLRPPLIGDQLGDGIEGDDTRDEGELARDPQRAIQPDQEAREQIARLGDPGAPAAAAALRSGGRDQIHSGPGSPRARGGAPRHWSS